MYRGRSEESESAALNFPTAVFRLSSYSTKVLPGQRRCRISSRETTSPGRSRSMHKISKGCFWILRRVPRLNNSRLAKLTSNTENRRLDGFGCDAFAVATEDPYQTSLE